MTDPATIERLAREAGMTDDCGTWFTPSRTDMDVSTESLVRFAALIAAHERERCAKVCDELPRTRSHVNADVAWYAGAAGCAAAIRAL